MSTSTDQIKKKSIFFFAWLVCVCCVCVRFIFFTHTKGQNPKPFFFLEWVGTSFTRERWWVYWLLIIYTLLLPWQFFTLIYIFFRNVEIHNLLLFFPQVTKKFWKKILNIQENFIWLKWFFKLFIYLFDKHFLKLVIKVCFFLKLTNYLTNIVSTCQGITIYDIIIRCKSTPHPPKTIWGVS